MTTGGFRIDVPTFDNATTNYLEFRKRAMLLKARMLLGGEDKQATVADDASKLEDDTVFDLLIGLLDSRFRHDRSTKLPDRLEKCSYC